MRLLFALLALLALPNPLWADKADEPGWLRHPLFGRVLQFAPVIAGSVGRAPDHAALQGGRAIFEYIPAGQSLDRWTEMHTLTGVQGLATDMSNAAAQAQDIAAQLLRGYIEACAIEVASAPLGAVAVAGTRATFAGYMACDHVRGTDHAESMVVLVMLAGHDVFTLQWAERGAALARPRPMDLPRIATRFAALTQVRLCTPPAGETAPYPSC